MRLSDAERRLSERAFAALAGADPRAFAPSAETLAETSLTNAPATRRVGDGISPTFFPKKNARRRRMGTLRLHARASHHATS